MASNSRRDNPTKQPLPPQVEVVTDAVMDAERAVIGSLLIDPDGALLRVRNSFRLKHSTRSNSAGYMRLSWPWQIGACRLTF